MMALALAWWVLVTSLGTDSAVKALGPYPSKALCNIAARQMMPGDYRFWAAEEVKAHKELKAARHQALIDAIPMKDRTPGKHHFLEDGSVVVFLKDGTLDLDLIMAWSNSGGSGPFFYAVTGCVGVRS